MPRLSNPNGPFPLNGRFRASTYYERAIIVRGSSKVGSIARFDRDISIIDETGGRIRAADAVNEPAADANVAAMHSSSPGCFPATHHRPCAGS